MIRVEGLNGVLEITLDHPKVNAIGLEMSRMLDRAFSRLANEDQWKVAIIHGGNGSVFSAGWDLKAVAEQGLDESADYGAGGFAGLTERFDLLKPVIAAVNGKAVGAGFEIVLACDIVVAADRAEFFLPETSLGIMADVGGVQRLPRKIPQNIAMEMLLTGRRLSADEAARLGLVNHVVPAGGELTKAREIARAIADAAPLAVRAIKEVVAGTAHLSIPEAFQRVKSQSLPTYRQMLHSEDHLEGPRAFAEKRTPRWTGR